MHARRVFLLLLCLLAVVAAAPARAQSVDPEAYFANDVVAGMRLPALITRARHHFRTADLNMDGVVNQIDAQMQVEAWPRAIWGPALSELQRHDLDFDGVITRDEVVRSESFRIRRNAYMFPRGEQNEQYLRDQIDTAVERIMRADRNGDGRIDWDEMRAFAQQRQIPANSVGDSLMGMILSLDTDGNGSVTPAEFDAGVERVFRAADTDGDGILSKEEIDALRARKQSQQQNEMTRRQEERARERAEARRAACAMPKASDAAKVILLRGPTGDALSTVTLLSQDVPVETSEIAIEPGDEPLYLVVVGSGVTIWRLTGAVERVERLVLDGRLTGPNESVREKSPLLAATGIARDKVTFLRQPECIQDFFEVPSDRARESSDVVRLATGKEPVLISGHGERSGVAVPSGQSVMRDREPIELTIREEGSAIRIERGRNRTRNDWRDPQSALRRFHPGGVIEIDPAAVAASHAVERYTTLPQEAGLLQLTQAGALTQVSKARAAPMEFVVQRKIRYPAALHGAHLVKFVIAPGVPLPDGDPGHSCVVMQESGQAVANPSSCKYE
jgi:Ca2+-binding EF-hand superfamily protein